MIFLESLKFEYDDFTLQGSLHLHKGQRLAIIGKSGVGKTTLLTLLSGMLSLTSGTIKTNYNKPLHLLSSLLFQKDNLFDHMTVYKNVALGMDPGLKKRKIDDDRLMNILKDLDLQGLEHKYPHELSGGQQQRVGLARCLVQDRPLMILDEPFSGLDSSLIKHIMNIVIQECTEKERTLVFTSHHSEEISGLGTHSVAIEKGIIGKVQPLSP